MWKCEVPGLKSSIFCRQDWGRQRSTERFQNWVPGFVKIPVLSARHDILPFSYHSCCLHLYSCLSPVYISKYWCLCTRERADMKSYSQGKMSLEGIFLNSILMSRPSQTCALTHSEQYGVAWAPRANSRLPWDVTSPPRTSRPWTCFSSGLRHTEPAPGSWWPTKSASTCSAWSEDVVSVLLSAMYRGDTLSSRKHGISEVKMKPFLRILYCNFLMIGSCIYNSDDYFNEKFCNGR